MASREAHKIQPALAAVPIVVFYSHTALDAVSSVVDGWSPINDAGYRIKCGMWM